MRIPYSEGVSTVPAGLTLLVGLIYDDVLNTNYFSPGSEVSPGWTDEDFRAFLRGEKKLVPQQEEEVKGATPHPVVPIVAEEIVPPAPVETPKQKYIRLRPHIVATAENILTEFIRHAALVGEELGALSRVEIFPHPTLNTIEHEQEAKHQKYPDLKRAEDHQEEPPMFDDIL